MNAKEIVVLTGTLGDSCGHLSRSLTELRQFTHLSFRQIVSDDGTTSDDIRRRQIDVCTAHGAEWIENPGPTYGISYNLNHLFETAATLGYEWVFLIEDAVRPGWGWLETALSALEQIGKRTWAGHEVGAIGMASSYENWHLACAGVLPGGPTLGSTFAHFDQNIYDEFWGSARHQHWNDGLWCWQRLQPGTLAACTGPEAESWPDIIKRTWRDPVRRGEIGAMRWDVGHPYSNWQATAGWPRTRHACWVMGASAWCLVNLKAWREVGRWRDGCTYYEGHLGVRLAQHGYLCINVECPPWLHMSGLAFRNVHQGREPRHHEPCDGPNGILDRDFGCNGEDHVDMARLARSCFKEGVLDAVNEELTGVSLFMDERWKEWL